MDPTIANLSLPLIEGLIVLCIVGVIIAVFIVVGFFLGRASILNVVRYDREEDDVYLTMGQGEGYEKLKPYLYRPHHPPKPDPADAKDIDEFKVKSLSAVEKLEEWERQQKAIQDNNEYEKAYNDDGIDQKFPPPEEPLDDDEISEIDGDGHPVTDRTGTILGQGE